MGSDLVKDTYEKVDLIRKSLLMAQSRHKSYIGRRRGPLEFEVDDHIFLMVILKRGVVRFDKQEKLSITPRPERVYGTGNRWGT